MENNKQPIIEEDVIDLKEIWKFVVKRMKGIVAIIVACAVFGTAFSLFRTPLYRSTATMAVMYDGSANESSSGKYTFSANMASTFVLFLSENVVLDEVSEITDYPVATLKSHLEVENTDLIINLSYTDESPEKAQAILAYIMETATSIADSVDEDGEPRYKMLNDNLKSFSSASVAKKVPTLKRDLMIALFAGIVLAAAYVLIGMLKDKTFHSATELEDMLGIPVLSQIPFYTFDEEDKRHAKKH